MKTKQYVEKAVHQWRTMFSCGEDTTTTLDGKKGLSSKRNNKSKDTPQWLHQMTSKIMEFGNIERVNTDSTADSQSEEPTPIQEVIKKTIRRPAAAKKTVPIVIETTDRNSIVSHEKQPAKTTTKTEKKTKNKKKKTRTLGPKKRLGRNPEREEFFQTVVFDLGYDPDDESESDMTLTTANTQQDKAKDNQNETTDHGPSSSSNKSASAASAASSPADDTFSISVMTMKEFDADGNYNPDVITRMKEEEEEEEKEEEQQRNYNSQEKMAQMMKGINVKSSIARMRLYKQKGLLTKTTTATEQQRRLEHDELRRQQEELLQKQLQQQRREKERKDLEEKLQKQLELQKKRDEAKQLQDGDKWEDEYSVVMDKDNDNGDDSSLNYSVSVMSSSKASGILKPSSSHLAPPSSFVVPVRFNDDPTSKDDVDDLLLSEGPIEKAPSSIDEEDDAPSDEEDEPEPITFPTTNNKTAAIAEELSSSSSAEWEAFEGSRLLHRGLETKQVVPKWETSGFTKKTAEQLALEQEWETFEGSHVFHMGLGKKHYTKWGHFKSSGFKWKEQRPRQVDW
mmetsp:Transcript_39095/g.94523  ORF Transcript_39095/g.94523 Transcript_39095/m.94523 type:complete len:566 (+) Transcript_39095:73-1770(+)